MYRNCAGHASVSEPIKKRLDPIDFFNQLLVDVRLITLTRTHTKLLLEQAGNFYYFIVNLKENMGMRNAQKKIFFEDERKCWRPQSSVL